MMTMTAMTTTTEPLTATLPAAPSALRLRLAPTVSRRTLLDGAWWPRSSDPDRELPGLILALNARVDHVTNVMLGPAGWDRRPRRLSVAGRRIRLGWFASQPDGLLTAIGGNGERVDLLVVAPDTTAASANAAMAIAADAANTLHTSHILTAMTGPRAPHTDPGPETIWESEGGHLHPSGS
jgi:uncharacterized protein DUF5994